VKVITRKKPDETRTASALRRLSVSPEALAAVPQITPLLKKAEGGLDQVIDAMRFAPDPLIAAFLQKYDSVPVGDREHLPIEAIALAAEVNVSHLLGSIMVCLQAHAVNTVKIIAMTSHPKITEARVLYGQLPYGEKDRTALDMAMGFLPSPKGPTFIGKAVFESGKGAKTEAEGEDDDPDLEALFPTATVMQEKLALIRQKRLPE
jgi:hypothetical protein